MKKGGIRKGYRIKKKIGGGSSGFPIGGAGPGGVMNSIVDGYLRPPCERELVIKVERSRTVGVTVHSVPCWIQGG